MKIILFDKIYIETEVVNKIPNFLNFLKLEGISINEEYFIKLNKNLYVKESEKYLFSFFISSDKKHYVIYRGLLEKILNFLDNSKINYYIEDKRIEENLTKKFFINLNLYNYQKRVLNELSKKDNGILVSDCGTGKTVMAISLISKLNQKTLVIVPTIEIQRQWVEFLKEYTDFQKTKIGILGGGHQKIGEITISLFQYFVGKSIKDIRNLSKNFGCLIVDECHRVPAQTLSTIVNNSICKYRYGFTATPKRKDKRDILIFNSISHNIIEIKPEELLLENKLIIPKIKFILINSKIPEKFHRRFGANKSFVEIEDYNSMYDIMSKSEERNNIIVEEIKKEIQKGKKALILINRINHGEILFKKLSFTKGFFLSGQVDKLSRKRFLENKMKDFDFLIATFNIASEGLDIKNLDTLFLVFPTTNFLLLKQAIGRIRRYKENKEAIVYDFVDKDNKIFYKMFLTRLKYIKKFNFPFEIIDKNPENLKLNII